MTNADTMSSKPRLVQTLVRPNLTGFEAFDEGGERCKFELPAI